MGIDFLKLMTVAFCENILVYMNFDKETGSRPRPNLVRAESTFAQLLCAHGDPNGLVFKAYGILYYSTLGSSGIE